MFLVKSWKGCQLRTVPAVLILIAGLFLLVWTTVSANQIPRAADRQCARIDARQGYGPYDYRKRQTIYSGGKAIDLVEGAHFNSDHRRLALRGDAVTIARNGTARDNLDYTLRAFPNHAPALYHLAVHDHMVQKTRPDLFQRIAAGDTFSRVSCYFERAIRFVPDDPNVHTSYGRFLTRIEEYGKAIEAFKKAVELASQSASAHYNLGLAYYAASKFEAAAKAAREAYRLGYQRLELRNRLKRKGHW